MCKKSEKLFIHVIRTPLHARFIMYIYTPYYTEYTIPKQHYMKKCKKLQLSVQLHKAENSKNA